VCRFAPSPTRTADPICYSGRGSTLPLLCRVHRSIDRFCHSNLVREPFSLATPVRNCAKTLACFFPNESYMRRVYGHGRAVSSSPFAFRVLIIVEFAAGRCPAANRPGSVQARAAGFACCAMMHSVAAGNQMRTTRLFAPLTLFTSVKSAW